MQGIVACFPKTDLVNPMLYEALRATGNGLCSVREQESTEASLCLRDQKISKGKKKRTCRTCILHSLPSLRFLLCLFLYFLEQLIQAQLWGRTEPTSSYASFHLDFSVVQLHVAAAFLMTGVEFPIKERKRSAEGNQNALKAIENERTKKNKLGGQQMENESHHATNIWKFNECAIKNAEGIRFDDQHKWKLTLGRNWKVKRRSLIRWTCTIARRKFRIQNVSHAVELTIQGLHTRNQWRGADGMELYTDKSINGRKGEVSIILCQNRNRKKKKKSGNSYKRTLQDCVCVENLRYISWKRVEFLVLFLYCCCAIVCNEYCVQEQKKRQCESVGNISIIQKMIQSALTWLRRSCIIQSTPPDNNTSKRCLTSLFFFFSFFVVPYEKDCDLLSSTTLELSFAISLFISFFLFLCCNLLSLYSFCYCFFPRAPMPRQARND